MDLDGKSNGLRFETMRETGQMDWGFLRTTSGIRRREMEETYCFLMILGYSRMRYIEFVTE